MANTTNTITLTEAGFDEALAAHPRLVVDFWASWCGPCRMLAPVLDEVAREQGDQVVIGKVNVDEQPGLAGRFSVRSIPTLLFFKDGEAVDTMIGAQPKAQIDKRITALKG
ncbi:MAG TPA: thioredoxin [Methylomirabilota bacterium]|jgi:thioredoxin 1|nr:thioredoxin [Methylomirabilota bacterium]